MIFCVNKRHDNNQLHVKSPIDTFSDEYILTHKLRFDLQSVLILFLDLFIVLYFCLKFPHLLSGNKICNIGLHGLITCTKLYYQLVA